MVKALAAALSFWLILTSYGFGQADKEISVSAEFRQIENYRSVTNSGSISSSESVTSVEKFSSSVSTELLESISSSESFTSVGNISNSASTELLESISSSENVVTTENIENTENVTENISENVLKLSFAGDFTIGNHVYSGDSERFNGAAAEHADNMGWFLEGVQEYFGADDFTIVNLETVISDRNLKPIVKGGRAFWFKGGKNNLKALTEGSVEGVVLANNHINDYGEQGQNDTIAALEEFGLEYAHNNKILYLEKYGVKIAVINRAVWNSGGDGDVIEMIHQAEKNSDFQIVFLHGGTEKSHTPDKWRVTSSRKYVDSGADLVLGNHPHVLQPIEYYNSVPIIYSLGNFCFGGNTKPEIWTMIYQLQLTVKDGKITAVSDNIVPCYGYTKTAVYNNYHPEIITDTADIEYVKNLLNLKTG